MGSLSLRAVIFHRPRCHVEQLFLEQFKSECLTHVSDAAKLDIAQKSCKPKAAVEIRRLRSILENQVGARNNPGRKHRKTGYTQKSLYQKKIVRKTYTVEKRFQEES